MIGLLLTTLLYYQAIKTLRRKLKEITTNDVDSVMKVFESGRDGIDTCPATVAIEISSAPIGHIHQ